MAAAALTLAALSAAGPAAACRMRHPLVLTDVRKADVVVVGRVSNYRIVLDAEARRERARYLAQARDLPPETRKVLAEQDGFLGDYARFDVTVDEVLVGRAGKRLSVTWNNSTFSVPDRLSSGPLLIALGAPKSDTLFGEPGLRPVFQRICAPAFIFESTSADARVIRRLVARKPDRRGRAPPAGR